MRGLKSGIEAMLVGLLLLPTVASAQILSQRCANDNVPADLAEARVEWMRQCALAKIGPGGGVDLGNGSIDYQESDPNTNWSGLNTYTSSNYLFWVNDTYVNLLYLTGTTYQTVDANGFYKWYRTRKKTRPLYPVFGSSYDIYSGSNVQLFPHPSLANCTLYTDRGGRNPASNFYVNGYCETSIPLLTSNTPVSPVSDVVDGRRYYAISVPAGTSQLVVETSGGTGDVDLYVRYNASPTTYGYDCRPYRSGNGEICTFFNPTPGTWYIMLQAYAAYSGVSLVGRLQ